jgi:hypothetical protein
MVQKECFSALEELRHVLVYTQSDASTVSGAHWNSLALPKAMCTNSLLRQMSAAWFFAEDGETRPEAPPKGRSTQTTRGPTEAPRKAAALRSVNVTWCPELRTPGGHPNCVDVWAEGTDAIGFHRMRFQDATFDTLVRRLARMNSESSDAEPSADRLRTERYEKLKARGAAAAKKAAVPQKKQAAAAAKTIKVKELIRALKHHTPMAIEPVRATRRYRSMMQLLLGSSRTLEAARGGGALPTVHMMKTLSAAERVEAKTGFVKRVCSVRLITAERKTKVRVHLKDIFCAFFAPSVACLVAQFSSSFFLFFLLRKMLIYRMLSPGIASQEVLRFVGTELKALGSKRTLLPVALLAPLPPLAAVGRSASILDTVRHARSEVQRECMQLLPTFQNPVYAPPAGEGGAAPHRWMSLFIEPVPHASSSPAADAPPTSASPPKPESMSGTEREVWRQGRVRELTAGHGLPDAKSMALHSAFYARKEAAFKLRVMLPVDSFTHHSTGSGSGQRGSMCMVDALTASGGQTTKPVKASRAGRGRGARGGAIPAPWLSPNDTATFKQSRGCMQQFILASQQAMGVQTGQLESFIRSTRRAQRECNVAVSGETLKTFSGVLRAVQHSKRPECPQPAGLSVKLHSYQLQSLEWMLAEERRVGGERFLFFVFL